MVFFVSYKSPSVGHELGQGPGLTQDRRASPENPGHIKSDQTNATWQTLSDAPLMSGHHACLEAQALIEHKKAKKRVSSMNRTRYNYQNKGVTSWRGKQPAGPLWGVLGCYSCCTFLDTLHPSSFARGFPGVESLAPMRVVITESPGHLVCAVTALNQLCLNAPGFVT